MTRRPPNDRTVYHDSGITDMLEGRPVMADCGYRGHRETLRAALNALAAAPDWLAGLAEPEWFDRYSARSEDTRFLSRWAARAAHPDQVGADGRAVFSPGRTPGRWQLPAVELLRLTWCSNSRSPMTRRAGGTGKTYRQRRSDIARPICHRAGTLQRGHGIVSSRFPRGRGVALRGE